MSVALNHTIVWCRNKEVSALSRRFSDSKTPSHMGPFMVVEIGTASPSTSMTSTTPDDEILAQHCTRSWLPRTS